MPKVTRKTGLEGKTKDGDILTKQEELFCVTYVLELGNGTNAAEKAYNVDKSKTNWRNTCASIAKENLRKPHLLGRIRELLDNTMNDETVDNELNFLIKQGSELNVKAKGIEIYNKIKNRYEKHQEAGATKFTLTEILDDANKQE